MPTSRMARRIEGIATIHQDNSVGCEKSGFSDYPKVDKIALELEQNIDEEQTVAPKEKVYYSSVAYLQLTDDTMRLDAFKDKGDYEGLLTLAKEYYDGNGINEEYTYSSPIQNRGDNLLIEDKDFAVVYNGSVGGTYEVMLKFTERKYATISGVMVSNMLEIH